MASSEVNATVILNASHCSTRLPAEYRHHFLIEDAESQLELLALTDHALDRRVRSTPTRTTASAVFAEVTRLVVEVERPPGEEEQMNAIGKGVLCTN